MIAEDELIKRFFSRVGSERADVIVGIGDDAAVLAPPADRYIVSTVDTINENVHFPAGLPARFIGAEPAWATLSLSIPDSDEEWLAEFADGLLGLADRFGVILTGGDTVRGPLSISVNMQGFVSPGQQITRTGARPGDGVLRPARGRRALHRHRRR